MQSIFDLGAAAAVLVAAAAMAALGDCFARFDADRDGFITKADVEARHAVMKGQHGRHREHAEGRTYAGKAGYRFRAPRFRRQWPLTTGGIRVS